VDFEIEGQGRRDRGGLKADQQVNLKILQVNILFNLGLKLNSIMVN
jgi:hypothetical protein